MPKRRLLCLLLLCAGIAPALRAADLKVGYKKEYERIEQAYAAAKPGDTILIYPNKENAAYEKVGLAVTKNNLTFRGMPEKGEQYIPVSGAGADLSGRGQIPRAIFQFNKGADNCTVENLALFGARNESYNGAGVRIHTANHITVRHCHIYDNEMGIQSNSDGTQETCVNVLIESCELDRNGSRKHEGYCHNLYVTGTSLTMRFCHVHEPIGGHNVKSRMHYIRIEYCYIHDSENRELDLVDGKDTTAPNSDAVLIGNVIAKSTDCKGNRGTIHFGEDVGTGHDGTLYLIHNTILTPYRTPVIELSDETARAHLVGNLISDGGNANQAQHIAGARKDGTLAHVTGNNNWFSERFSPQEETGIDWESCTFGTGSAAMFKAPGEHDYRIPKKIDGIYNGGAKLETLTIPPVPGAPDPANKKKRKKRRSKGGDDLLSHCYQHPQAGEERTIRGAPDCGAYEVGK